MILFDYAEALALLAAPPWAFAIGRRLIDLYGRSGMVKENYCGRAVSPALGPALLLGYLPVAAVEVWSGRDPAAVMARLFLLTGFAFYGLWDDLISDTASGFRGHFGAWRQGRLTAGMLKVITAILAGFLFIGALPFPTWRRLAALPLILLSANGVNLFDRRPGRALKIFFSGAVLIIFLARPPVAAAQLLLPLMAVGLAVAPLDLEASAMIGDCGANLLGAALGIGAVLYLPLTLQAALLLFWAGVHLFCEYFSLSRVIERNPILRRLDCLGRFREKLI
ncbi:MAG TPA: hypothetical protein PKV91_01595 [Bacillota bacterium]|nr:hypothetical protein [Bacillota bacterium]HOA35331.1 hypothetical protein [Bacillota bacterium]HOJ84381.1 hypothetical protein [Bacillota bacterium]HOL15560.1 hypothetical protein [Bacillota bacterium]HPZ11031.1 hypothetical protein [Bacillota bacterium]